MSEKQNIAIRITARVKALLARDWLGSAGRRFRQSTTVISDYTHENIRPTERLSEAPELAWKAVQGAALEKHAKALKDYAEEENERIDLELKRKTLDSKARQEKAAAEKMESEARTAQIRELQERIKLFDDLRRFGAIPMWDEDGNMQMAKASPDFDWDGLQKQLFKTGELQKLSDSSAAETDRPRTDETPLKP